MRKGKFLGIIVIFTVMVCSEVFAQSRNQLANTRWEGYFTSTGKAISLTFGQNTYSLSGHINSTGKYDVDGDIIILYLKQYDLVNGWTLGCILDNNKLTIDVSLGEYILKRIK